MSVIREVIRAIASEIAVDEILGSEFVGEVGFAPVTNRQPGKAALAHDRGGQLLVGDVPYRSASSALIRRIP
jgi:hypothetical protein